MKNRELLEDPARLAVLRDLAILDTPAEPDYDDIARLASACCRSPIAAVNFVDAERHWTKAIVGVQDGQGANVSGDLSFCAATVMTPGGLLSLSDKSLSDEWRSHPFVTGPPPFMDDIGEAVAATLPGRSDAHSWCAAVTQSIVAERRARTRADPRAGLALRMVRGPAPHERDRRCRWGPAG